MNKKDMTQKVLELCLKSGAQAAKVSFSGSQKLKLKWRKGGIESLEDSAPCSISCALFVDGRFSQHASSDLRPEALSTFISRAVELTRLLEIDEFRKLPPSELIKKQNALDLKCYDKEIAKLKPEDCFPILESMENALQNSKLPIIETNSSMTVTTLWEQIMHSNGFEGSDEGTYMTSSCSFSMEEESGKRPRAYGYDAKIFKSDLRNPSDIAKEAIKYGAYALNQKKLPSGKYKLIIDNRISASLLSKYLAPITGADIQQKRSYFEGKKGQVIASPLLNLIDEPLLERALGSRKYDIDGFAAKKLSIFNQGALQNYLIDYYYSLKLGVDPTTASFSNLILKPGEKSQEALIKDIDKGIFVTSFLGGNADRTTGDFSYGISGVLIENGELKDNLAEMNMTGNFLQLFQNLTAVGNDPDFLSSIVTPTLRFDDVNVSGL